MQIVRLPAELTPDHLRGVVVVFDVLRATTTIATALANGAAEVRVFASLDEARIACQAFDGPKVLAGELHARKAEGFDLGNSPREFTAGAVGDKTIFLATTNGTKALSAAKDAPVLLAAAVVNASATRAHLQSLGLPVTLLCSGTDGAYSPEDELGARLVWGEQVPLDEIERTLRDSQGGHNIVRAGLAPDIADCAKLDALDGVVEVREGVCRLKR